MNILTELANKYSSDKGTSYGESHNYTEYYYEKWKDYKYTYKKILEIGIDRGGSLRMMRDFFENAIIHGIDVQKCWIINENRIQSHLLNATIEDQINNFIKNNGSDFDMIIDDGGHNNIDQQITFSLLFKHLKKGGLYIIEDLHTSLMEGWGLPPDHPHTCLNVLKRYQLTKKLESPYIYDYNDIENIEILDVKNNNRDITSFIYKSCL